MKKNSPQTTSNGLIVSDKSTSVLAFKAILLLYSVLKQTPILSHCNFKTVSRAAVDDL